ncbi:uncharacterized protein RAG0_05948 [Rhynchosporium agropyri]|uniref:Uncharacterized protein n=1 Tax=Rhynchosporium agropyri TaxID=914238 RepID=A0A1E1KFJ4_9HELO|nr:uncharacterized protein RAG0_05948 [Rhynchosporium agropyri]
MSFEDTKSNTDTPSSQSQSGSGAVQRGGAGMENTPASSDTPANDSALKTSAPDVPDFATKKPGGSTGLLENIRSELSHGLGKGTE